MNDVLLFALKLSSDSLGKNIGTALTVTTLITGLSPKLIVNAVHRYKTCESYRGPVSFERYRGQHCLVVDRGVPNLINAGSNHRERCGRLFLPHKVSVFLLDEVDRQPDPHAHIEAAQRFLWGNQIGANWTLRKLADLAATELARGIHSTLLYGSDTQCRYTTETPNEIVFAHCETVVELFTQLDVSIAFDVPSLSYAVAGADGILSISEVRDLVCQSITRIQQLNIDCDGAASERHLICERHNELTQFTYLIFCLATGMRNIVKEAPRMSDLDLDTGTVTLKNKFRGRRVLPLPSTLFSILESYGRWLDQLGCFFPALVRGVRHSNLPLFLLTEDCRYTQLTHGRLTRALLTDTQFPFDWPRKTIYSAVCQGTSTELLNAWFDHEGGVRAPSELMPVADVIEQYLDGVEVNAELLFV